jgi:putative salt-induced outer membrane protein YdiY
MMRFLLAALLLCLVPYFASAQDAPLPPELERVLSAASDADDPALFEQAVRLIALTRPGEEIAASAAALSPERELQARTLLGLPALQSPDPMLAAPMAEAQGAIEPAAEPDAAAPLWRAAPLGVAQAMAGGDPENWSGEARLGLRYDGGNSDRQDYTLGLQAERALAVWGFESELSYAYSEVEGAVGRDELRASAQVDREAGERWTLYANGEYRNDALSGFDYTGLAGVGVGYRVFARDDLAWTLEAGPAVRIVAPETGDASYVAALDLGSDFEVQITEAVRFTSATSALIAETSRAEQRFALDTALGSLWALRLSYQYTYEFEPEPGFENADTRTDLEVVRRF